MERENPICCHVSFSLVFIALNIPASTLCKGTEGMTALICTADVSGPTYGYAL